MPLKYEDARELLVSVASAESFISEFFPINPLWLAEGAEPQQLDWPLLLPTTEQLALPYNISFSSFVETHRDLLVKLTQQDPPEAELPEAWLMPYAFHWLRLQVRAAKVQTGTTIAQYVFRFSAERLAEEGSRVAVELLRKYYAATKEKPLTAVSVSANYGDVMSPLGQLLNRLNQATKAKGTKAELAKFLDVPRSCVSAWLSGSREPGGDTTLRLLQWVEQREAKQNSSGSASTPPEPVTQKSSHQNENPQSGPTQQWPTKPQKSKS